MRKTIEDMVQQEIMCCMSSLVSTLAQGGAFIETRAKTKPLTQQNIMELCEQAAELAAPVPDYEEAATQAGWLVKGGVWFNERFDGPAAAEAADADTYEAARQLCEGEQIEPYDWEVYEHWAVTNWLAEKLIEQGEKVDTDFGSLNVWARTTTGQAISMDGCIERIYKAMMQPVEA